MSGHQIKPLTSMVAFPDAALTASASGSAFAMHGNQMGGQAPIVPEQLPSTQTLDAMAPSTPIPLSTLPNQQIPAWAQEPADLGMGALGSNSTGEVDALSDPERAPYLAEINGQLAALAVQASLSANELNTYLTESEELSWMSGVMSSVTGKAAGSIGSYVGTSLAALAAGLAPEVAAVVAIAAALLGDQVTSSLSSGFDGVIGSMSLDDKTPFSVSQQQRFVLDIATAMNQSFRNVGNQAFNSMNKDDLKMVAENIGLLTQDLAAFGESTLLNMTSMWMNYAAESNYERIPGGMAPDPGYSVTVDLALDPALSVYRAHAYDVPEDLKNEVVPDVPLSQVNVWLNGVGVLAGIVVQLRPGDNQGIDHGTRDYPYLLAAPFVLAATREGAVEGMISWITPQSLSELGITELGY